MTDALLIFKPDTSYRLRPRTEIWRFLRERSDVEIRGLKWFHPPAELIESHYDFLKGRPFFPWLIEFMTVLPLVVGTVRAEPSALDRLRSDLGETRIQQSRPGSIRELYGIYGGINCLHLSDSPESAEKETRNWSGHLDLEGVEPLEEDARAPDHTYRLRSLATQVAGGIHVDLAKREIVRLLGEETRLSGEKLDRYAKVIIEGF